MAFILDFFLDRVLRVCNFHVHATASCVWNIIKYFQKNQFVQAGMSAVRFVKIIFSLIVSQNSKGIPRYWKIWYLMAKRNMRLNTKSQGDTNYRLQIRELPQQEKTLMMLLSYIILFCVRITIFSRYIIIVHR